MSHDQAPSVFHMSCVCVCVCQCRIIIGTVTTARQYNRLLNKTCNIPVESLDTTAPVTAPWLMWNFTFLQRSYTHYICCSLLTMVFFNDITYHFVLTNLASFHLLTLSPTDNLPAACVFITYRISSHKLLLLPDFYASLQVSCYLSLFSAHLHPQLVI